MTSFGHTESSKAFEKAADAIENAKYNLKGGFYGATANRAYYGCYYCLIGLLYTQNVYAKTHQGTKAKFSELFINADIFPPEMSDDISMLFDYRQEADYDLDEDISYEEAATLIDKANEIYRLTNNYFHKIIADMQQ